MGNLTDYPVALIQKQGKRGLLFADGHVQLVTLAEARKLRWE